MTADQYNGEYLALYCGQSSQGDVRLGNHEKAIPARRMGMTHIHVHFASEKDDRFNIETDLRRSLKPPLNEQRTPEPVNALGGLVGALTRSPSPVGGGGGLAGLSTLGALGPFTLPSPQDSTTLGALANFLQPRSVLEQVLNPYPNALTGLMPRI